jgi:hypothetical protein
MSADDRREHGGLDLDALEKLERAATPGPWHWAGNVDSGEPYLATWIPGAGRCQVLAIGSEDRATTGRRADEVRSYARESGLDPEDMVREWATDNYGEPVKEPRLWFYSDLMADPARDKVVYEVAPEATTRDDPKVYRADIVGIRHPDAEFIAAARQALPDLIAAARERDRLLDETETAHDDTVAETGRADQAETELDELRAKVAAVLAAHQPYRTPYREADICDTCSRGDGPDVLWPCPTAATVGDQP